MRNLLIASLFFSFAMSVAQAQTRPNHTLPQFEKLAPQQPATPKKQDAEKGKTA